MSFEGAQSIGDGQADSLIRAIEKLQGRVAARLAALVSRLQVDASGRILNNSANLQQLASIMVQAASSLVDDEFVEALADYVQSFDAITDEVGASFEAMGAAEVGQLKAISRTFKAQIAAYLLDPDSYAAETWLAATSNLTLAVVTGSSLNLAIDSVSGLLNGGSLLRSVGSSVATMPMLLQRAQTQAAAEAVGAVFFRWQGRPIATTRVFCRDREGKVWHRDEIAQWGRDAVAGVDLDGNGKPGWAGMAEGTDELSIFVLLGGWYGDRRSCRHVLIPLSRRDVPEEDLERMLDAGLIDR